MDRNIIYAGAIPLAEEHDGRQINTMTALHGSIAANIATAAVDGLACTPGAGLAVSIAPGSIFAFVATDSAAYGALPANATQVWKQGINTSATSLALAAPTTAGTSIVYLIEAQFSETDTTSTILPYYNPANPAQNLNGPNNSGTAQYTQRVQRVALQAKAGTQATTGEQVAPTVDAGWTSLYTVTLAYGATSVVTGNIAVIVGAPFLAGKTHGKLLAVNSGTGALGSILFTPPIGCNFAIVDLVGAGGAGGGTVATGAGQVSIGAPGTAGARVRLADYSPVAVTCTVGAHGSGASGVAGGSGGSTTYGGATAPGGVGGAAGASVTAPALAGVTAISSAPSAGSYSPIAVSQGDAGSPGFALSATAAIGSRGGLSFLASAPAPLTATGTGPQALCNGGGGNGALAGASAAAQTGGNGADGLLTIYYYS